MVVISNGFNKFHIAVAAEELYEHSYLSMFLTGAYPTEKLCKILRFSPLKKSKKLLRLVARGQDIKDALVVPLWFPESLHAIGLFLGKKNWGQRRIVEKLNNESLISYGKHATKHVLRAVTEGARIYHYRAGFGHESVQVAKDSGMITICDHSIAHPALLEYLVTNNGLFPTKAEKVPIDSFWRLILRDIEEADHVLVNSNFVKETFLHQGWDSSRIHVIYWGVDDAFFDAIPFCGDKNRNSKEPVRILFAGYFDQRKGANVLIKALEHLDDLPWYLEIAGGLEPDIREIHGSFFMDSRVGYKGLLSRKELARCMSAAEVFVFPSLAEGSARVIFEALAAGCYIITTPNSGSIVEHGVHGALVPPGDADALAKAIRQAIQQREKLTEIGQQNAELVRSRYRQEHYGNALVTLYDRLFR